MPGTLPITVRPARYPSLPDSHSRGCPGEAVFGYGFACRWLSIVGPLAGAEDGPDSLFGPTGAATMMNRWFPMAVHLIDGLFYGIKNSNEVIGQRERLLALGSLSAGLTHELNNPASAAVSATAALRNRVAGMRHKLALIAAGKMSVMALEPLIAGTE